MYKQLNKNLFSYFEVVKTEKINNNSYHVYIREYNTKKTHKRVAVKLSTVENNNIYRFKYNCKSWNINIDEAV